MAHFEVEYFRPLRLILIRNIIFTFDLYAYRQSDRLNRTICILNFSSSSNGEVSETHQNRKTIMTSSNCVRTSYSVIQFGTFFIVNVRFGKCNRFIGHSKTHNNECKHESALARDN